MKKQYKTLKGLHSQCGNQLSYENIKNGYIYHKKQGYVNINLGLSLSIDIRNQILEILGGDRSKLIRGLNNIDSHWSFVRFIYSPTKKKFFYCAGQDYTSEINSIRKDIYEYA